MSEKTSLPVRYPKPKILTVDLPVALAEQLRRNGYNVLPGTFGRPYKVEKDDGYLPLIATPSIPNCSEQEIVVVDLAEPEPADKPKGEKLVANGELDWFAKTSLGVIDPRPRKMTWVRADFDRILKSGGAFVLFADFRLFSRTGVRKG